MKSAAIAALAALACLTSAAPTVPKNTYYLRTESVDGDKFDGLYVSSYHTSAGANAAYIVPEKKFALPAYIKDKSLYFSFGKGPNNQYPMQLDLTDPSASWGTTSINIVNKPKGSFALKDGHVIVTGYPQRIFDDVDMGAHWRVCKWTHGVPELFWNFPETWDNIHPKSNPGNCERVNLKAIPV